jgi:hypothetical protein
MAVGFSVSLARKMMLALTGIAALSVAAAAVGILGFENTRTA